MLASIPSFIDEVIVTDNASGDNTAGVARERGAKVIYETKRGYGHACQAGLVKAEGDVVAILDGDASYPLSEVENLLLYLQRERRDFVVGCRYPLSDKNVQPFINKIANYFISWLIRVIFKVNLKDSQSGMMVFHKDILNKIKIGDMGMDFSFCQELKISAFLHPEINSGEAHISFLPRRGKVKIRKIDALRNFFSVLSRGARLSRKIKKPG